MVYLRCSTSISRFEKKNIMIKEKIVKTKNVVQEIYEIELWGLGNITRK